MFELAELGRKTDKQTYARRVPVLREELLDAQFRLRQGQEFSTAIVIAGAEGAGKGEAVNRMLEWLDARGVATYALGPPTAEEREKPSMQRFWRKLPARGSIAIFFGSWYTEPIVRHISGEIDDAELDIQLNRILAFERMLTREHTLLLKFWFHITKKHQGKTFKKLQSDPTTAWRVTKRDWKYHQTYDAFIATSSGVLQRTSTGFAPWQIIEAHDRRYRDLTLGEQTLHAIEHRLNTSSEGPAADEDAPSLPQADAAILNSLDLRITTPRDDYKRLLKEYQGRLGRLARRMTAAKRSAVLVFEGPDAAGKGGVIRRLARALDARFYQVISIAAPSDEEAARPYLWRFWRHTPSRGQVAMFDRSWYGRVLVERVEQLCSADDWKRAYAEINHFEEQLVDSGVLVVKYWLAISTDEQLKRFRQREATGYKRHKITDEDWRNREKWDDYQVAASEMIGRTSTLAAPWTLVEAEDKRTGRIKVLKTLCKRLEELLHASSH